jgi:uncharacterized protein VirK/YbjX
LDQLQKPDPIRSSGSKQCRRAARAVPLFGRHERWLVRVLGCVCTGAILRRALRLAARLYPDPDRGMRQRLRFLLRTLWYRRVSAVWFSFLDGEAHRRQWVRDHPSLAEKLHRPYRRSDLSSHQRLAALIAHYRVVEALGWEELVGAICRRPVRLASLIGKDGVQRHVVLELSSQFDKEGEICLHLIEQGERIYSASFSMVVSRDGSSEEPGLALDVGSIQGPGATDAQERVRRITRALHGLRPRDLILDGLRAVADAAGATNIIGVSARRHIYHHWRKRRKVAFDYDAFWREQQGRMRLDGDFDVACRRAERPVEALASSKRAEARRRHGLIADMHRQIAASIAASWRAPLSVRDLSAAT